MTVRHGNSNAGRANLDRLIAEDLSGLIDHFQLFAGIALILEAADLRNRVERNRMLERFVLVVAAVQGCPRSLKQIGRP